MTDVVRKVREQTGLGTTLQGSFQLRANSLDVLRLSFALLVVVAHASAIAFGHQPQLGNTQLGALAVDGFFVLSGFLITASYLKLQHLGRFCWHRFLRIMPAFWAVLVVTAVVVAPLVAWLEGHSPWTVLTGPDPSWRYITANMLLYISDFGVSGYPIGTHESGVINGALWTLFYEAVCYGLVAGLGVFGLLRRARWVPVALMIVCGTALTAAEFGVPMRGELFLRFFFVFLLGVLGWLFAHRIPIRWWLVLTAAVVFVGSTYLLVDYRPLGGVAFAYLCLYAAACTPWLRFRLRVDLSYGVYLVHWPIEVILALAGAAVLGVAGFTALSVTVALLVALVSWTLIEKPALARKEDVPRWLLALGGRVSGRRSSGDR